MTQATEKDICKWCKFWDNETAKITIDKLSLIACNRYVCEDNLWDYDNCTPLTQEQIKVLGLEE